MCVKTRKSLCGILLIFVIYILSFMYFNLKKKWTIIRGGNEIRNLRNRNNGQCKLRQLLVKIINILLVFTYLQWYKFFYWHAINILFLYTQRIHNIQFMYEKIIETIALLISRTPSQLKYSESGTCDNGFSYQSPQT